jgi:hypothetical protein
MAARWFPAIRDGVSGDLRAVDLGEVRRDLAGGQAAGGQRQHDLVDAAQPPLPRAHDLRVEAAIPVPRDLDLDRTDLGEHRLCPSAVARVAASAADRVVLVVAEVVAHLFLECGLHDRLRQAGEQATPPTSCTPSARAWSTSS